MRLQLVPLASLIAAACVLSTPATAQLPRFEFDIRADPAILPANGVATATVTVTVHLRSIRNGTRVDFTTTAGTLESKVATLAGGQARVRLRAGTQPDVAQVTAIIGGFNRQTTGVEFTNEPIQPRFAPKSVIATGDYLALSLQRLLIVAKGHAEFKFGNLTITANNKIEYNLSNEFLIAEGAPGDSGVTLTVGARQIHGDRLVYHLYRHEGMVQRAGSPPRVYLRGVGLLESQEDPGTLNVHENEYDIARGAWYTARKMVIRRNDRIMLQQASLYLKEKKQWTFPNYVVALPGYQPPPGSRTGTPDALGFNSEGGFNLDLPLYYRADASGSGAVHFQRVGGGGFYADQPGWSMRLQDDYFAGEQGQGSLVMDRVGRTDWGATVGHNHEFARGFQGSFFIDSPFHRDVFSQQTFYKDLRGGSLTVQTSQDVLHGSGDDFGLQVFGQSNAREVAGLTYFLAGSFYGSKLGSVDNSFQRSEALSFVMFPQALSLIQGGASAPGQHPFVRTSLQPSFRLEAGHASGLGAGFGNGATLSLSQWISPSLGATVNFNHDQAFKSPAQRSLSFSIVGGDKERRFVMSAFGTRSLTENTSFAGAFFGYRLGRHWHLTSESAQFKFGGETQSDHELSGGYILGQHEIKLTWSQSRRRVYFQIGSARL